MWNKYSSSLACLIISILMIITNIMEYTALFKLTSLLFGILMLYMSIKVNKIIPTFRVINLKFVKKCLYIFQNRGQDLAAVKLCKSEYLAYIEEKIRVNGFERLANAVFKDTKPGVGIIIAFIKDYRDYLKSIKSEMMNIAISLLLFIISTRISVTKPTLDSDDIVLVIVVFLIFIFLIVECFKADNHNEKIFYILLSYMTVILLYTHAFFVLQTSHEYSIKQNPKAFSIENVGLQNCAEIWEVNEDEKVVLALGMRKYLYIDCLYFSITTITTTGYGDIFPKAWLFKLMANSEMLIGQVLLVFAVGFLFAKWNDRK